MFRKLLILLLVLGGFIPVFAQPDSSHMRISLVTCGPGDEEVWEVFGHTAVRVVDSVNHTDLVYNYGTFDYGPNFRTQFMRGKLLYSLSVYPFNEFLQEYIQAKRSVQDQVLLLNGQQKKSIYSFLEWNALPENKYYKYDFFFDNCATRIRDIFPRSDVFGAAFKYANVLPSGKALSFRDIINAYFYRDHWTRLGINILLGSRIDRVMTNADIMFLPDYLRDGVAGASANGRKVSTPPRLILEGHVSAAAGINWALMLTLSLALLTILGLSVKKLRVLGKVMSALLMLVTGLLGILILVMWFGTDHQGCGNNMNILWCLPLNIILAFGNPKGKGKYAVIAVMLIFVSLVLHLLRVQGLILEMMPLLLALLFVYGHMYRQSKVKPVIAVGQKNEPAVAPFFYRKMGSGPAVVLLHGFPESGTLWKNIWDELAAHNTLIIPNLPGSGETPLVPMSIAEMAEGVKNILDIEQIDTAVVAGHSMGGYTAFAFADLFPERVAGISAVHSTTADDDDEKKKLRVKSIELIQRGAKELFIENMVPNLFSDDFKQSNKAVVEEQIRESLKMSAESMVNFYNAMLSREDTSRVLDNAKFPVQWIIGEKDNVLPYKKILEKCHQSPVNFVTFYKNCGHMSMLETPGQLAKDMKEFIDYCYKQGPDQV